MDGELDPFTLAFEYIADILADMLGEDRTRVRYLLSPPSRREYGDLSFPVIRYSKKTGISPGDAAQYVMEALSRKGINYIKVEVIRGYINFKFNVGDIMKLLASRISTLSQTKPLLPIPRHTSPKHIVVEHTSANPIHPMHMGHARNSSLGDSLARLLKARGHEINRRFYIDDVGKQVAVAALGVRLLGIDVVNEAQKRGIKPDELLGWIYAVTHTLLDVKRMKQEVEKGKVDRNELDKLLGILATLEDRRADLREFFNKLLEAFERINDPEELISNMMKRYEEGLEPEKSLIRTTAKAALKGIRETLERIHVEFDAWDWESDLLWTGRVRQLLETARKSPYFTIYKEAEALDLPRFVRERIKPDPSLVKRFNLPKGFEIPPLILRRSDGTTLYTTRDIAYSLYKFEVTGADEVYNVVGADQRLAQLQVRLSLAALGYWREALNLYHYDYELVRLPGVKMSSRRGRIVTLDSVLESLKALAEEEVAKRNPNASKEWIEETAEKIAVGALRFRLVQVSAPRVIIFDYKKALDLAENSGPYLQYTYARATSILRKLEHYNPESLDPKACGLDKRRRLIIEALRFPLTAAKAADDLAPELLASYLLKLADLFNSWYQEDTVIREPEEGARNCKALIVELVRHVLHDGLTLLGVPALERM